MSERRTDAEVMQMLRGNGPHERVRAIIADHWGRIEQAVENRGGVAGVELRRMEYECVDAVMAEVRNVLRNTAGMLWPVGRGDYDEDGG